MKRQQQKSVFFPDIAVFVLLKIVVRYLFLLFGNEIDTPHGKCQEQDNQTPAWRSGKHGDPGAKHRDPGKNDRPTDDPRRSVNNRKRCALREFIRRPGSQREKENDRER